MALPILELIAQNVLNTLKGISTSGGYNVSLAAERRKNPLNSPADLKAVVGTGDPTPGDETEGSSQSSWVQPFEILIWTIDSETSTNPADQRAVLAWADCNKALMIDKTRGGYAWKTAMRPPEFWPDAVVVHFDVMYDTVGDDPFTSIYT